MRLFLLRNALGATWDLTDNESFFSDPKGLGGERKSNYIQIRNSFEKTESNLKQKTISGEIIFKGYKEHFRFCAFIQHKPLVLEYTAADETFMMQVDVEKLSKTELEAEGLRCNVSFKGITTWYRVMRLENLQSAEGKVYAYTYPYTYTNTSAGAVEFNVDSTEPSPVRMTVMGPCINPSWRHYVNGAQVATGAVIATIADGNKLIIDDTKIPYEIAEYTMSGALVRNLYQASDFSTKRFLQTDYGLNKISFTQEGNTSLKAAVEVQVEYAFV